MHKGPPASSSYDVVVIGAGLGGLSCAAFLAKAGLRVLVAERHMEPGGYATTFRRGPYQFECSLHMIDAAGPTQPTGQIFAALGITAQLELQHLPILRREIWPAHDLCVPASMTAYLALLTKAFPDQAEGLSALRAAASRAATESVLLADAIHDTSAPDWEQLSAKTWQQYTAMTTEACLQRWISDPQLCAILSQLTGYYGLSSDAMSALFFLLIWHRYHEYGGYYPKAGSSALSLALCDVIKAHGGIVAVRCPVEQIILERRRAAGVMLKGGVRINAKAVVSNANTPHTFNQLLDPRDVPPRFYQQISSMKLSVSACKVWFVCDCPVESLGLDVPEIWWNASYQHDTKANPMAHWVLVSESLLAPDCAPPGKGVFSVIWMVPTSLCESLSAMPRKAYLAYKQQLADDVLGQLERHLLPGIRARVEEFEVATPRTFARYTGNPGGALFGWSALPSQVAMRRPGVETPIPRLYQAGAWTRYGSGFSAVLLSGQVCSQRILAQWHAPSYGPTQPPQG